MNNKIYTLENADKLIALWTPRLEGYNINISGQRVTVTELSKEKISEYYKIWVETKSPYRDELTDVIHGNLDFLNMHLADRTKETNQEI